MVATSARSRNSSLRFLVVLGAAMLALTALMGARSALVSAHEEPAHPAHIHPGTCDTLDPNPIAPLNDVSGEFLSDGAATAGEAVGSGSINAAEGSTTTVELSLADILAADHAINVHASAEDVQTYIACGNVSGAMVGDSLVIGLGVQNDSGHTGIAILTPAGEGTTVTVYLTYVHEDMVEAGGSPAADEAATGEEVAIDIVDFAFSEAELTIPVGTTVTWTNQDAAPHTATADDGSFASETLNQGDSFSFTFDTPGTFSYFCAVHPDMTATITVE